VNRFTISEDGLLSDQSVQEVASMYQQLAPWADGLTIQANAMVVRAYTAMIARNAPCWAEFGLSDGRFTLLRWLYQADDQRLPMMELARLMNVSPANVTKLANGLERDGLIQRMNHPRDRRLVIAALTPDGLARFEAVLPSMRRSIEAAWSGISDQEKRVLIHILSKLQMTMLSDVDVAALVVKQEPRPGSIREVGSDEGNAT
jgi:DNA-binding MarR family transcriptional regulator